jgi:ABC-type branched-subunit amino acid transport system permease subunit
VKGTLWAALSAFAAGAFAYLLLRAESQTAIAVLLAGASVVAVVAARVRKRSALRKTAATAGGAASRPTATADSAASLPAARTAEPASRERMALALFVAAMVAVALLLREDDFALLLVARVLIAIIACLGLNVQFGYAGVVNFAGASFFGVGGYTAAVLSHSTHWPHLLLLFIGGVAAAGAGSLLLLPVLRTRGHYAALVTIAFALLFRTFLEVNDALGGPQGLKLKEMTMGPLHFNDPIELGAFEGSFYLRYVLFAVLLAVLFYLLVQRVERSFIGVALDAVRLDEIAARCFGLSLARWKIAAFTLGNFVVGVAGALSAFLVGFIAPNNYAFSESLLFVAILLLGGMGNPRGLAVAAAIVIVLPEKLQVIQEYRFLLFSALVVAVLVFKPAGLLPRPMRRLP